MRNSWKEAEKHFLAALARSPKNLIVLYDLGVVYARQKMFKKAARMERRALQVNENYVPAYIELAWILAEQGNLAEAEKIALKAVELEPTNDLAKRNLQVIKDRMANEVRRRREQQAMNVSELA